MISVKYPKKISNKKLKQFFINEGLGSLVNKKHYSVDGYEVTKKDYLDKTLLDGIEKASEIASNKMKKIQEIVGF